MNKRLNKRYCKPVPHFKRGSLLLEAILSVVILSVSLALIIQSMTTTLRAAHFSSHYTTAALLLENKIFELIQKGAFTGESATGVFAEPFDRFNYAVESSRLDEMPGSLAYDVRVTVFWKDGSRQKKMSVETYLLGEQP